MEPIGEESVFQGAEHRERASLRLHHFVRRRPALRRCERLFGWRDSSRESRLSSDDYRRAHLVSGTRGAGKTTCLGALLWELPTKTRTVVIEDTRELPVESLQRDGRDVQSLLTTANGDEPGVQPAEALKTALRLGEGALVVGEVRGNEASVLYEAMRSVPAEARFSERFTATAAMRCTSES
ncbi:Type II/IV secretion system protein [Haladaptatus litoreus]|uniref:Type II/IV secretion system protein n=1 Tax=Haladaptatus litoreus TaxID=553468 RepID=A0A1N6WMI2_9EURY|nr:Type II/IV secretion system protein [Haladaptatus litoreus]